MNHSARNRKTQISTRLNIGMLIVGLSCVFLAPQELLAQSFPKDTARALNMADFILSLQNADGAIADSPGAATANNDSNMEYALIALGAAYSFTNDERYLAGLESGIKWLAAREEMTDPFWKGSWYLQYSANPPYNEIPVSGGPGTTNVRGVDATSALFVYLLYLDQRLTGSDALVQIYCDNAQTALGFIINHNLDTDGLSWSSWLYYSEPKKWQLYLEKYSADQGDVYLGMHAGALLYDQAMYRPRANTLMTETPASIFNIKENRYAVGLNSDGTLDNSTDGYSEGFAQGYLSWMWGQITQNESGMAWLRTKVLSNGSIITKANAPAYSLNVAMLGLGDNGLGGPAPVTSFTWLVNNTYDAGTGGVEDSLKSGDHIEFDNVTGFCAASLLGFVPFD
jgi:hypothetical protein